jgi:transglutaminase-like putative cysteine protease
MRLRISHETLYRYDTPAGGVIQTLRLTPRNHDGQYVLDWRIDISEDCRLDHQEDAFGNITHTFTADGPLAELVVRVDGEVDIQDTNGIIRGTIERFPPSLYLRETGLTRPDPAIVDLARTLNAAAGGDPLKFLHLLLGQLHEDMAHDTEPTPAATTAAEAFGLKRGACQDLAHIFIAAAREVGVPGRCVGGYLFRPDGVPAGNAGHAWAEAYVPDIGWVGFDPANCICPTDAHVRVAVGLDYLGAAPVRGTRSGGGPEDLAVTIQVEQSAQQTQN